VSACARVTQTRFQTLVAEPLGLSPCVSKREFREFVSGFEEF
jgi:hypothetical protein